MGIWSTPNNLAFDVTNFTVTSAPMSVDEVASNNFKVYPNPVKDVLNLSSKNELAEVSIYNMLGQKVLDKVLNSTEAKLDTSAFPAGNYFVKLAGVGKTENFTIVKE